MLEYLNYKTESLQVEEELGKDSVKRREKKDFSKYTPAQNI